MLLLLLSKANDPGVACRRRRHAAVGRGVDGGDWQSSDTRCIECKVMPSFSFDSMRYRRGVEPMQCSSIGAAIAVAF